MHQIHSDTTFRRYYTEFGNWQVDEHLQLMDEQTSNGMIGMIEAMWKFNKSLFISSHQPFYNDSDIAILGERRTIAPPGLSYDQSIIPPKMELHRCKASAKELIVITKMYIHVLEFTWYSEDDTMNVHKLYYILISRICGTSMIYSIIFVQNPNATW